MPAVKSSNIKSIEHINGELIVEFNNGTKYSYSGGSLAEHYEKMLKADSPGGYFHQHIKGKFDHKKIDVPKAE